MLNFLHNLYLIDQFLVLLERDVLFYSDFFEGDDAGQRLLLDAWIGAVLLVGFVDDARRPLPKHVPQLKVSEADFFSIC